MKDTLEVDEAAGMPIDKGDGRAHRLEDRCYCRFINSCFDAKSAAIKIKKCGKIEKFAQALNEGLFSRGKSADVPTQGAETSPRDGEDAASTMGGGAERTSARETGPEAPRVLVRPSPAALSSAYGQDRDSVRGEERR